MTATPARRYASSTRRLCLAGLFVLLALLHDSRVASQGAQTIGGYQLMSETLLTRNISFVVYRATLTNAGPALARATATATSHLSNVVMLDNTLSFGPVAAGGAVLSSDSFLFLRTTRQPIDWSGITWAISATPNHPPVANAGADLTAVLGQTARLDGSGSSDPDGNALTYAWSLVSRPAGSVATLSNPTAVRPTFVVDQPGSYVARLIVSDGFASSLADTVTVATLNSPPVANAGPDQTALVTQTVTLNGSGSSDVDGNPLTFAWSFASRPSGSVAALSNPAAVAPSFVVDRPGTYVIQLVVNDGRINSPADTVSITTRNSPPVANAGPDQSAFAGATVTLDGSGSTDVDGDPLTYAWALTTVPTASATVLNNSTAVRPTFQVDRPGTYVAQLIVSDGTALSVADTVTITTQNSRPVANAGPDQSARTGRLILLDGTGSSDADGDPLRFRWSFTSVPPGSAAALFGADTAGPSFVVDRFGTYIVQLIVDDGLIDSTPDTVTITTTNSAPTANAGPDQLNVPVGTLVTLTGIQSSDPDNQPLSYSWSLLTQPAGSSAALGGGTTALPTFTPDVAGDYVAQLIVNDGSVDSAPDTVLISANSPPIADAGPDQQVVVGATVHLDGSLSRDPDGNPIAFFWDFTSTPAGSAAVLQDTATASPSLVADVAGDFVVRLTVTDSNGAAATDSVTVTVSPPLTSRSNRDAQSRRCERVRGCHSDVHRGGLRQSRAGGAVAVQRRWRRDVHGRWRRHIVDAECRHRSVG